MIRRNARLRREYLYRKNLEGKERATYERKKKIKECLANGTPIPTELRDDEEHLRCLRTCLRTLERLCAFKLRAYIGGRHEISLDDDRTFEPKDLIDDEYARSVAGPHATGLFRLAYRTRTNATGPRMPTQK